MVRILASALFILTLCAKPVPVRQGSDATAMAKTTCQRLGWQFDVTRARVKHSASNPALLFVDDPTKSVCLVGPQLIVRDAHDYEYESSRRTHARRQGPFVSSDAAWYAHGISLARIVWPGIEIKGRQVEHMLPNDTSMRASDSRTVRLTLQVISPPASAGDRITIIVDRDEGKLIHIDKWPVPATEWNAYPPPGP